MPKLFNWTPQAIEELKERNQRLTKSELAAHYSISLTAMYAILRKFNLQKPRKQRNDRSPVGTITDHDKEPFIMTEEGWVRLHHYNWKRAGRTVPKGYVLGFRDLNPANCDLENLVLKTQKGIMTEYSKKKWDGYISKRKTPKRTRTEIQAQKQLRLEKQAKEREERKRVRKEQKAAQIASKRLLSEQQRAEKAKRREETKKRKQAEREINRKRAARQRKEEKTDREWQGRKNRKRAEIHKFSTKQVDYSQLQKVQVDKKTWIYLKPGQTAEDVKKRYGKAA